MTGGIFSGEVYMPVDHPGAVIIRPFGNSETSESGRPHSAWGPAPILVITDELTDDAVLRSAEFAGHGIGWGHVQRLRREAKAWLHSSERVRCCPFCVPGEIRHPG